MGCPRLRVGAANEAETRFLAALWPKPCWEKCRAGDGLLPLYNVHVRLEHLARTLRPISLTQLVLKPAKLWARTTDLSQPATAGGSGGYLRPDATCRRRNR